MLALSTLAAGQAVGDPAQVRVLLMRSEAPLAVVTAGGRRVVASHPAGLAVDGRVVAVPYRIPPPGPHALAGSRYRGALEFVKADEGLEVVNEIPLEAYVAGTLLREVDADWGDEALRAQAVAVRTYALYRRGRSADRAYDLEADTAGQVYGGLDAEAPAAWAAVRGTHGEYLAWDGAPILAAFHGTAGGRTASAEEVWGEPRPYLIAREVEGEEASPDTYWRLAVPRSALTAIAAQERPIGAVTAVRILEDTPSGRVGRVALVGTRGEVVLSGRALRRALGPTRLRSTLFRVQARTDAIVFVGSGYGHGVGMSQWGARVLARGGADYRSILSHFYAGAELRRLPEPARAAGLAREAEGR